MDQYTRYLQGLQGPTGYRGSVGPQGIAGTQGGSGPQGLLGINGPDGNIGSQGPTDAGLQGTQGFDGDPGTAASESGTQGNQGVEGPGAQGAQGQYGWQGSQSVTTLDGPQGYQGSQGIQGPQGDTNTTGLQGREGPQGPQGVQGPQGETNADNTTGSQGTTTGGIQGATGNQGINTGTDGNQGRQGTQGAQNPELRGYSGRQGPQGYFIDPELYFEVYDDFTGTGIDFKWLVSQQYGTNGSATIDSVYNNGVLDVYQGPATPYGITTFTPCSENSSVGGLIRLSQQPFVSFFASFAAASTSSEAMLGLIGVPGSLADFYRTPRLVFRVEHYYNSYTSQWYSRWVCEAFDGVSTSYSHILDPDYYGQATEFASLEIRYVSPNVYFYLNDVLVASTSISTSVNSVDMQPIVAVKETSGTYSQVRLNSFYIKANRQ